MKPATRKQLRLVHLSAALAVGLLLVGTALTGLVLVWRPQLDTRLNPHLYTVRPAGARLSPDEMVSRALAVHKGGALESIRYYGDPTAPFLVYFTTKDYVHLNPYSGEVLGIRQRYGDFFGWLEGFHKFLKLEPEVGERINGSVALTFGGIIMLGLAVWWPASRRALKANLSLNNRLSGRIWKLNLHRVFGGYASAILLVSALTGVPIAFDWVKDALYPLTFSTKSLPPSATPARDRPFAGFDAASHRLESLWPGAHETYIPLPKQDAIAAYAIAADAPHPYARSYAYLDPADGSVLRATPYARASRGFRLYYWMMSLHTGMIGGVWVQLLLFLSACSVPLLAYTGTASFLKRKLSSVTEKRSQPLPAVAKAEAALPEYPP